MAGLGLLVGLGLFVSNKLGSEAGWAGLTGPAGLLVGLGLGLVSDTSAGQQEIKELSAQFRQKWTHGRTPKISRPAGRDFGPADMGGGGGWGRDLSALRPCGAEAN